MSDSDRPPDYPDSAEEADEDTDTDEDRVVYVQPPLPPLTSPRGTRIRRTHSQLSSPRSHSHSHSSSISHSGRRQHGAAGSTDPYLDSLLARSVHALEMSNALLQSSMSTQSSLSAVLHDEPIADLSLEARAHMLSRRVSSNRGMHSTWVDDLDEITRSVEDLVGGGEADGKDSLDRRRSKQSLKADAYSLSRSAPSSSFLDNFSKGLPPMDAEERVQARRRPSLRRPSLDSVGGSHLEYSNHDRSHFIAPAPRALTIYVDSTDDPDLIKLPPTLGLRTTAHLPPTPLPSQTSIPDTTREPPTLAKSSDSAKNLVNVLSSYVSSPPAASTSGSVSSSPRFSFMARSGRSSSTSSGSKTIRRVERSKSSPITSTSPTSFRSRSLTPMRTDASPRVPRPMTPPIEELSASSSSSSSDTLHVDRTLESLRTILGKQPPPANSPSSSKSTPLPAPRPLLLSPPTVAPVSSTSNATASVSRLFTKNRHSSSTRPPSPPRQSVLKNRSEPATPTTTAPPTPSVTGTHEPFAGLHLSMPSLRSTPSSGRSTPKRISFAELPESYAGSKPGGAPSKFRDKMKGKERAGRGKGKGWKGKGREEEEGGGWWTGWLLGAAGTGSGAGLSMSAAREERLRGPGWSTRPGYVGGGWEEWGA